MTERLILVPLDGTLVYAAQRSKRTITHHAADLMAYHCTDFTGKSVLDVGGLNGETMVLFRRWGASVVHVVEPVEENWPIIEANAKKHDVPFTLMRVAVHEDGPTLIVHYSELHGGFGKWGGRRKGLPKVREMAASPLHAVLAQAAPVDIAKFDCEGCEQSFAVTDPELLRTVPEYIIESHGGANYVAVNTTLTALGYQRRYLDGDDRGKHMVQTNYWWDPTRVKEQAHG